MPLLLSVIIPSRNRSALLARALRSLQDQTMPPEQFEILVVDSGSADDTGKIAAQAAEELRNLRYIFTAVPGLHAARNLGMAEARGAILVYADDDIRAAPTWLAAINESFADPQVVLVGGRILPEFETAPPPWFDDLWQENEWGRFLSLYSLSDCGESRKRIDPTYVWGCNFSIRKDVVSRLGGFHPDSMPERFLRFRGDGELGITWRMREAGLKAEYHPEAQVFHFLTKERLSLEYIYARSYNQGITDSYMHIRSGDSRRQGIMPFIRSGIRLPARLLRLLSPSHWRAHRLERVFRRGRNAGYRFHQGEVARNPELRKWVLRETYGQDAPPGE